MYRLLIFDTETGGLSPERNDLLQLSYQVVDADTWQVFKVVNHYFEWTSAERVDAGAIAVNGLSREYLATLPCSDRRESLTEFLTDLETCRGVVGHNVPFDMRFIECNCTEASLPVPQWPQVFDTMRLTVDYCQLPSRRSCSKYKFPRLSELAMVLDIEMDDLRLHDSSADVELTFRCFRKLCNRGIIEL